MRRDLTVIVVVVVVALSGCAALTGDSPTEDGAPGLPDGPADIGGAHIQAADNTTDTANTNYTLRAEVNESAAGSELNSVGATLPRDNFLVEGAAHEAVSIGVDTDGDGTVDRTFEASTISGVNNNDFSFDITLDTDYTLQDGDVVVVRYPAITNPSDPGEYPVAVRLNDDQQRTTGNITIG